MCFQPIKYSVNRASKDESFNQFYFEAFKLYQSEPRLPSMTELFQESENDLLLFKETQLQSKRVLQNDILQSKYKWYFINNTLKIIL